MNTKETEDPKKTFMRELLNKTENLRDSSVSLQEKMSHERTILENKKENLEKVARQISETKANEREYLLGEQCKLHFEIEESEEIIEQLEAQYGVILEELNIAHDEITKIEQEIILIRGGPDSGS